MYIRKPAVAGSFYPGNPEQLQKQISDYLEAAGPLSGEFKNDIIMGIISPHAGYIYSGPVAAYGYNYFAQSSYERFIVIAPSHRGRFNGISVIPEGLYRTPLGDVEIDSDLGRRLEKRDFFSFIKEAHESEHSLEVQIPFLQVVKSGACIVPLVIGTTDPELCRTIGKTIADEIKSSGKEYGIIISTDLSHYHPYNEAVKKDSDFIIALESFDENRVADVVCSGRSEACGEGAVLTGMSLAGELGAKRIKTVKYANSGDTAGSKDQVVGYLSALILG
ncbi:MAG: AmmeMemoRadiSam system protein B [Spirochaetae bacterium HGW-Spirochaetae-5]|nr:MAG: AmmeMemoRadiSam system protein B [Spirochaetae bacterium HGW-Spirochaetae-5]